MNIHVKVWMWYRVPERVVVGKIGRGTRGTASTVEGKVEFAILQVERNEVNMSSVGQVQYHTLSLRSLNVHTQHRPKHTHTHTHTHTHQVQ